MMQRLANWYHGRQRRTRIVLVTILLLTLGGVYLGLCEVSLRSADGLTVTITPTGFGSTGVIYHGAFGKTLAVEAQHLLNDETTARLHWPLAKLVGPIEAAVPRPTPHWHYHLAFTWHGILVETADMSAISWPETYTINALGMPDVRVREPKDTNKGDWPSIIGQLATDSGGVIPLPTAS